MLSNLRRNIKNVAPTAEETIRYGIPTLRLNSKNLVHFAAYKKHIGFYPTPEPIAAFEKELACYKKSKGSIQFPLDRPLPMELIKRMVRSRLDTL